MLRPMRMGFGEILIVAVVVLLVFGANKIPQLGDALGKGIRAFRKSSREDDAIDVTPGQRESDRLPGGAATSSGAAASESRKG